MRKIKMKIQDFIEKLRQATGLSYIDVICKEKHKTIFRYNSGKDVTGKERLYMYSCSKVITAVAALRLVEEGKLSLEDKACKYLPEIKNAFVLEENGEKRVVGQEMTIRHLFTMSAGFTYNLATYVNSGVSGEVGTALYAYAKEAYAYGYKHSVGTIE
jgi:CubicO group peptidase (beta-lactamase class C family)